jgi:CBS domain containing-hemolysin-like protein
MKTLLEKAAKKTTSLDPLSRIIKFFKRGEGDTSLRETIEELIEENSEEIPSIESDERQLLGNVLNLRDLTAHDIMTPRADFIAVSDTLTQDDIMAEFVRTGISWLVVYSGNIDNVIGLLHAKDMLAWIHSKTPFDLKR